MHDEKKRLAREDGIVAVEHAVETSWSDDRAPVRITVSHNASWKCALCRDALGAMTRLAEVSGGEV